MLENEFFACRLSADKFRILQQYEKNNLCSNPGVNRTFAGRRLSLNPLVSMKTNFYTLLYIDPSERRVLSGKEYTAQSRIDLFVRNACLLDRTLRLNGLSLGGGVLTNDTEAINASLREIGYELTVREIPFSLNVPAEIRFYSAHFKIDAFRFFAGLPQDEYSILLDSDVVCMRPPDLAFGEAVSSETPMFYRLEGAGAVHFSSAKKIDSGLTRLDWAGGEFIGGNAVFFQTLYDEIGLVWSAYLREQWKGLSHIGDEMPTSISLQRLRERGLHIVDAGEQKFIYRYWGNEERCSPAETKAMFVHLPYDKVFCAKLDLSALHSVSDFSAAFRWRIFRNEIVRRIKRLRKILRM